MEVLRTPDHFFDNLPDYPFQPHYAMVAETLRMHYVKEGDNPQEVVLMLHGEPTWSYLYRKMIPIVTEAGFQVIAPDLIGFGKSDKPTAFDDYTYQNHVDWITALITQLDLQNITLVCQDWGGLIGLRVAAENPDRFKRIATSNTFLPTGDVKPSEAFLNWRDYSQNTPEFKVGNIVSGGCKNPLADAIKAAYDAPFPENSYKAGARIFPTLVPISPDNPASEANRKAWQVLQQWKKPFLTAFGDSDPITKGGDLFFQKVIPGAQNQPHITLQNAAHFSQEDKGEEWAKALVVWMKNTAS